MDCKDKPCHGRATEAHLGARARRSADRKTAARHAWLLKAAAAADRRIK